MRRRMSKETGWRTVRRTEARAGAYGVVLESVRSRRLENRTAREGEEPGLFPATWQISGVLKILLWQERIPETGRLSCHHATTCSVSRPRRLRSHAADRAALPPPDAQRCDRSRHRRNPRSAPPRGDPAAHRRNPDHCRGLRHVVHHRQLAGLLLRCHRSGGRDPQPVPRWRHPVSGAPGHPPLPPPHMDHPRLPVRPAEGDLGTDVPYAVPGGLPDGRGGGQGTRSAPGS